MKENITINENKLIVNMEGSLDSTSTPILQKMIEEKLSDSVSKVEVNFDKITYISSAGLRLLLGVEKKLGSQNLVLINPNQSVQEVLKLSGLSKYLNIENK